MAATDVFAEIVKATDHTEMWGAVLVWYSPSATRRIWPYGLEHNLRIHGF